MKVTRTITRAKVVKKKPTVKKKTKEKKKTMSMHERVLKAVESGVVTRLVAWGPQGTGKTSLGHIIARKLGLPLYSLTITKGSAVCDLGGMWQPKEGKFEFFDGPVTSAFREEQGAVLLINEISDATNTELEPYLMNILDDVEVRRVLIGSGEVLIGPKNLIIMATMNENPDYLRPALRDRFEVEVRIGQPSKEMYDKLSSNVRAFCGNLYAKNPHKETGAQYYSYRRLAIFDKLKDALGHIEAAQLVFGFETQEQANAFNNSLNVAGAKKEV